MYHLIEKLTETQREVYETIERTGTGGLEYRFMSKDERQIARQLVKMGVVTKGQADCKGSPVAYWTR